MLFSKKFSGTAFRSKIFATLVFTGAVAAFSTEAQAQLMSNGYTVVACAPPGPGVGGPANGVTLAIKDTTQYGTLWQTPANRGGLNDWSSATPSIAEYFESDFGDNLVFATTIASNGDIYTVTTGMYSDFSATTPVDVYKIDGVTGAVSLVTSLTGARGGSYLEIDEAHNQLFVVNMDHGQIDRIDLATNSYIDSFDPLGADDGATGLPALGERLLGMTYNPVEDRVYYSVWSTDEVDTGNANTIRSVGLTAAGAFDTTDDVLEITLPNWSTETYSHPAADLEFNDAATRLLVAEVGYNSNSTAPITVAHETRVIEYIGSSTSWAIDGGIDKYDIGKNDGGRRIGDNARGGVDWSFESIISPTGGIVNDESAIIATADAIRLNETTAPQLVYGFQYVPASGGTVADSINADVDYDVAFSDKNLLGDVDVYRIPETPTGFDLALIKTLAPGEDAGVAAGDNVDFSIKVINQGDVESFAFDVTDQLPAGLGFVSGTGTNFTCGAVGQLVTCSFSGSLQPGDVAEITLTVNVNDITQAPFRNWAEIESDAGDDVDSTPGSNDGDDPAPGTGSPGKDPIVNHNDINHSGTNNDPLVDEDDSDFEDLDIEIYDLALIKQRYTGPSFSVTGNPPVPGSGFSANLVYFEVEINNHGNVAANTFSFTDTIPLGLTLNTIYNSNFSCVDSLGANIHNMVTSGSLGLAGLETITCTTTQTLQPGQSTKVRFGFEITDYTQLPLRNWAEIETDDGDDVDSVPGSNDGADNGPGDGGYGNDPVINHNDIDHDDPPYDDGTADEDDSDYEDLVGPIYDLALIKTLAPGQSSTVTAGSTVQYVIQIMNQGSLDSGGFTFVDMIPTGMSFVSATPAPDGPPAAGATGQLTWSIPASSSLGAGDVLNVMLELQVDDVTKAPFRNWAEIEFDSGADEDSTPGSNDGNDNDTGTGVDGKDDVDDHDNVYEDEPVGDEDDSDYEDVDVELEYDLALIKELTTGQAASVAVGDNVSYTITIQNQGTANSDVYTVTDMIPAGMSFVSATPAPDGAPAAGATGLLTWTMSNLMGGLATPAEATITLVLKVDSSANAPFRNWAEIESIPGTETDEDSTPGSNDGNDSGTGDGGNGNDDVTNHNNVDTDEPTGDEDDSDYEDVAVTDPDEYDLALIKTLATGQVASVAVGDNVSYEITIQNQGEADSGTYSVTDMIPAGMSFVSATPAPDGAPAAGATGLLTWTMTNLTGGLATPAEATITLVLKVDSAANAPFRNWAEIESIPGTETDEDSTPGSNDGNDSGTGDGGNGNDDVTNHNNVDTDEPTGDEDDSDYEDVAVTEPDEYDLALVKTLATGQAGSVSVGDNVSYEITVQNQGVADSGVYSVTDMIPAGMSFVSATPAPDGAPAAGATGLLTWTMTNLTGGLATPAEATITLVLKVDSAANAPFRNWAEIESIPGTETDEDSTPGSNDGNDSGTGDGGNGNDDVTNHNNVDTDEPVGDEDDSDYEDITIVATDEYDLALIKELATGQAASVAVGDNVSYTITIQNQGAADSGTYSVTDMIPAGMSFVSATPAPDGAPAAGATGLLTWTMTNLTGGLATPAEATITLVLKVDSAANAPFRNWAEIESIPGTETDNDSTPGSNDGDDSGTGDGGNGNDDVDNHNNVDTDEPTGDEDDSDYEDVTVTTTTPEYDLALIKTLSTGQAASVAVGDNVSYDITIQNQGAANSGTYSVTDMIPAGMSFVSAAPAPDGAPATGATGLLTWTLPNLTGGLATPAETTITLVLKVDSAANAPFRNWAEIESIPATETDEDSTPGSNDGDDSGTGDGGNGNDDVDNHNNVDTDEPVGDEDDSDYEDVTVTTPAADRYDLALVKHLTAGQPSWIDNGDFVDYDVFVKNQGNVASGDFTVVDAVPSGMQWVPLTAYGPNVNCTHDGSATGGLATCNYTAPTAADLAPGLTIVINIRLLVTDVSLAPFANWAEITADSSADYGVTDDDSQPGDNNAQDTSSGDNSTAGDPFQDQTDINLDPNTPLTEEDDSDPAYVFSASTTPITLQSFAVDQQPGGSMAVFNWTTSMEDANVGFNLYGRSSGGRWKRINETMIPAESTGENGATYSVTQDGVTATEFAITDVDVFGKETVHGPFNANRQYGLDQNDPDEQAQEPIETVIEETETSVTAAAGSAYLRVKRAGVQRVTFEELLAAGHDWSDIHVDNIAVTHNNESVPARVVGNTRSNLFDRSFFGGGGYVEFVADRGERIYRNYDVYKLSLDSQQAARIAESSNGTVNASSQSFVDTTTWEQDNAYSRVSPSDDPWYAAKLLSLTEPVSYTANVTAAGAVSAASASISVTVWGGHDDLDVAEENQITVSVNGTPAIDTNIGGLTEHVLEGYIPVGVLEDGVNEVTLSVSRANVANMALVHLDSIKIDYQRQFKAVNGALTIDSDATGFTVSGVSDPVVYRRDANGVTRVLTASADGSASFAGTGAMAEYFVADESAIRTPQVHNVPTIGDMTAGPAEYLVITHRKFNNADLERLVMARQSDGLTTKVVNVSWIYDVYAGGNVSTDAIRDYIAYAAAELETRYVLLVGGDTYDYRNVLGKKARSFIPTLYGQSTEAVSHAPVDPLYGDVDSDGIPDLAVGRLPVQTKAQLRNLVDKTLQYAEADYGSSAVLAADDVDDSSQADFAALTDAMIEQLPESWNHRKAYLGKIGRKNARSRVTNRINDGVALTTWMGHSDLKIWGFDRLLRNRDIRRLTNTGRPTVVTQYGCWNTYYVDPDAKSMAHTWLNAADKGAAVVTGASTLTEVASEQTLSALVTKLLTDTDLTIGEAILAAKRQMASEQPLDAIRDVISGYTILGDPAVRIAK